ncbi:MAG: NAD-dependent deacylase [Gemmatimonadetes bacterium]|nr:NAD-dependent deacylase [Gemmatimonadota bacterium]
MIPTQLIDILREASHVAVLTGAGVSAESGIPTFRDALTGLWANYRPEELATEAGFRRDPELVWNWYRMRRQAIAATEPNAGHLALARLGGLVTTTLITQNVDGLHARAGSPDPIELHGNITRVKCADCGIPVDPAPDQERVPRCSGCGGLIRPDVVWFGELLPAGALERARAAALDCDLFLSVGTSNLVEPAASLPWMAGRRGTPVIVINTSDEGQRTGPSIRHLIGPSATLLPALIGAAWPAARGGLPG